MKAAFFHLHNDEQKSLKALEEEGDEVEISYAYGRLSLVQVLLNPFLTICGNAGILNPLNILNDENKRNAEVGIDVSNWQVVNLYERGIVDATLSIIYALNHAVTNTIMTIRANGGIVLVDDKK